MTTKSKLTEAAELKVVVTRVVNAPCDLVFRAWTDPEQMAQWYSPQEVECRGVTADVRVGGAFRIHMVSPKGDHFAVGKYLEVVPSKRLQFTWQWESYAMPDSRVTVDFENLGNTTRLTLTHMGFPDQEDADEHNQGWTSFMEKFARWAAQRHAKEDFTGREFVFTREFEAPRELVFAVWTDSKHLAQWWGPHGFTNPVCEWDAKPGNAIHVVMRAPDGMEHPMGGEFREVIAPELLVFTAGVPDGKGGLLFEILHSVVFREQNGKTTVMVHSRVTKTNAEANKYIGGFEAGMSQSLERLGEEVAASSGTNEIVISRVVCAPRELVWNAMTDPKQVIHWWGPRGFTTTIEVMDVRPGGIWKKVLHGPDGTNYPNESVFLEVVPPERLVFDNAGGREGGTAVHFKKIWTFDEVGGGKTKVTILLVFASAAERARVAKEFGAVEGGRQTLERLSEVLAAQPVIIERTFAAPVDVVWRALTDFAQMKQWYFPQLEAFRAEVGFETRFAVSFDGKSHVHIWNIKEVLTGTKIAYRWRYDGYPGDSLLTLELTPEGTNTRLKLTHSGLETFLPGQRPELGRENFLKGWTHFMGAALGDFLASLVGASDDN